MMLTWKLASIKERNTNFEPCGIHVVIFDSGVTNRGNELVKNDAHVELASIKERNTNFEPCGIHVVIFDSGITN